MAVKRAVTAAQLLLGLSQLAAAVPAAYIGTNSSNVPSLGAVASESTVCSRIGTDLLEQGGNAIDALVGTVFCVGTIGMYHSGIGGGGFMLVRDTDGGFEFIDFRETAPAAYFEDMYVNDTDLSLYGGLAAGVPGELRGLEYAHNKYGALPWKTVMTPAVNVARHGFEVTADTARYLAGVSNPEFLTENPTWAIDFAPNGTLVQEGQIMTRKRYADTLETISEEGPDAFYKGAIAEATIAALQATNGTMTVQDLANYTIELRDPVTIDYRGYKLTSCSAPSGGEVALSILNIVSGFEGFGDPAQINLTTHRLDEAMRWSYGMRTNLGDPSFVSGMAEYQADMLSETNAADIRAKISNYTTYNVSYYDPGNLDVLSDHGTSHVVAADKSGLAVSITTTINTIFGSRVMVPETGVIMNNEMNDFSTPGATNAFGYEPSEANYIVPGKRPLSSISPTIVEYPSGGLFFISGSAGGSRIITATVQIIHNAIDRNMTSLEALSAPRMHDQLSPNYVSFEYAFDNSTTAYMKELGHTVEWVAPGSSTAQALRLLPNGTFEAAGEPRQLASGGLAV
ncbi:Gamma-glutamyltranspeptidase 1 [Cytospora mali]|uniref:Glutathione hydrolase n=1 Tax=Cytospora mali TaxID=578113 RepID=A0A194VHB5_CYTMA|nr:Gamma-glutamyltranspeptidase 1 [Valsa mali]